jgi:hypothetical protein
MPLLRKACQDHGGVGQGVLTAKRKANTYPRREQPSGRSLRLFAAILYKNAYFYGDFSHFMAILRHILQNCRHNLVLYAVDFFTLFLYNVNILFTRF